MSNNETPPHRPRSSENHAENHEDNNEAIFESNQNNLATNSGRNTLTRPLQAPPNTPWSGPPSRDNRFQNDNAAVRHNQNGPSSNAARPAYNPGRSAPRFHHSTGQNNSDLPTRTEFLMTGVVPLTAVTQRPEPETVCSVCLENIDPEPSTDVIRINQCGHYFHTTCVAPWFEGQSGNCPNCRAQLFRTPQNDGRNAFGPNPPVPVPMVNIGNLRAQEEAATQVRSSSLLWSNINQLREEINAIGNGTPNLQPTLPVNAPNRTHENAPQLILGRDSPPQSGGRLAMPLPAPTPTPHERPANDVENHIRRMTKAVE
jgi:hypothetical protein